VSCWRRDIVLPLIGLHLACWHSSDYDAFVANLNQSGLKIETGRFGAMITVQIENDGPVTLILEREEIV
jgi:hypothetical protein